MLSFKPHLGSFLEWLKVSPGSAFHGLPGKVMDSEGFFWYGEEGIKAVLDSGDRGLGDDGGKSTGFISHHEEEW